MHDLTHLDLFSGIGGFAIAAELGGFRTVGFSEVDPFACRVLEKHWPGVPNVGDVRKRENFARFRGVTVLSGGFPCQPFSVAGRAKGTTDHRNLWPAMLGVIDETGPDWVIGENVPNLANMVLDRCLDALAERGFQSEVFDIPACARGLPTMERHLWIVAEAVRPRLEGYRQSGVSRGAVAVSDRRPYHDGPALQSGVRSLPKPAVLRSRKGVPCFVDRIRGLGNAIPPPIVAQFFQWIAHIENGDSVHSKHATDLGGGGLDS